MNAPASSSGRSPVLIETLWNVKLNAESDRAETSAGINRNIVECKGFSFVFPISSDSAY